MKHYWLLGRVNVQTLLGRGFRLRRSLPRLPNCSCVLWLCLCQAEGKAGARAGHGRSRKRHFTFPLGAKAGGCCGGFPGRLHSREVGRQVLMRRKGARALEGGCVEGFGHHDRPEV